MSRSTVHAHPGAIVVIALFAGACSGASPSGSAGPSSLGAGSAPPSGEPTRTPSASPSPSLTASLSATEPPSASLAVEGGDPVTGQLGTFTWGDGGSDSPWLPGSPIGVGAGERLTVTIAGVGVATWSAKRVPAGTTGGSGATAPISLGTGGPPIAFDAPGNGSWSVQVTVDFDDGIGSATYYWLVTVR